MTKNDNTIDGFLNSIEIEKELRAIETARAAEALRVTAGHTIDELKAMPDQALGEARHLLEAFLEVFEHNDPWTKTTRKNAIASIRTALAKAGAP